MYDAISGTQCERMGQGEYLNTPNLVFLAVGASSLKACKTSTFAVFRAILNTKRSLMAHFFSGRFQKKLS